MMTTMTMTNDGDDGADDDDYYYYYDDDDDYYYYYDYDDDDDDDDDGSGRGRGRGWHLMSLFLTSNFLHDGDFGKYSPVATSLTNHLDFPLLPCEHPNVLGS